MRVSRNLGALARCALAAVGVIRGGAALLGGRFDYGDWTVAKATVRGPELVAAFYGYSPFFGRITGLFELAPALLLLVPRTRIFGALGLMLIWLNTTAMYLGLGFPWWVTVLSVACCAVSVALLVPDRARLRDALVPASRCLPITLARYLLAAVFTFYGAGKLLGGQYFYGDWVLAKATTSGPGLVWAFYGYSPCYGRFTGLLELVPALLLLTDRTRTVGALGLFAVALNITVMDFAYDYPVVKYFVLGYTALAAAILGHDRGRLTALLRPATPRWPWRRLSRPS